MKQQDAIALARLADQLPGDGWPPKQRLEGIIIGIEFNAGEPTVFEVQLFRYAGKRVTGTYQVTVTGERADTLAKVAFSDDDPTVTIKGDFLGYRPRRDRHGVCHPPLALLKNVEICDG